MTSPKHEPPARDDWSAAVGEIARNCEIDIGDAHPTAPAPLCLSQHTASIGTVYGCLRPRGHQNYCEGIDAVSWGHHEPPALDTAAFAEPHTASLTEEAQPARVADMLARDLARVTAERDAARADGDALRKSVAGLIDSNAKMTELLAEACENGPLPCACPEMPHWPECLGRRARTLLDAVAK